MKKAYLKYNLDITGEVKAFSLKTIDYLMPMVVSYNLYISLVVCKSATFKSLTGSENTWQTVY